MHFQDVAEKCSPYEALIEVTSAEGFNDTSLSAAFPLHTAVHSPALSNLSKLSEISETAEEGPPPQPSLASLDASAASPVVRRSRAAWKKSLNLGPLAGLGLESGPRSPGLRSPALLNKTSMSQFLYTEEAGQSSVTPLETPPIRVYAPDAQPSSYFDAPYTPTDEPVKPLALPTQKTTRDNLAEFDSFDFKPKVKLGPRPVTVTDKRRTPQAHGTEPRPTAALPAGVQVRSKRSDTGSTMSSTMSSVTSVTSPVIPSSRISPKLQALPIPPPIPNTPEYFPARPSSRGSSKSLPNAKSKGMMTPEKQRLLKAVEMRKKQLQKAQSGEDAAAAMSEQQREVTPVDRGFKDSRLERHSEDSKKADSGIDVGDDMPGTCRRSVAEADGTDAPPPPPPRSPRRKVAVLATPEKSTADTGPADTVFDDDTTPRAIPDHLNVPLRMDSTESLASADGTRPMSIVPIDREVKPELSPVQVHTQQKRRGLVLPLQIEVVDDESSDVDSDDELIDELHGATLHEAKPLTVSKSPATPVLTRRPSGITSSGSPVASVMAQRSASIPLDAMPLPGGLGIFESPSTIDQSRSQSLSMATPTKEREDPMALMRKGQVSSGISKRIAALAEVSTKESSPPSSSQLLDMSPGASLAVRKSSLSKSQDPPRAPSFSWNQKAGSRLSGATERSQTVYTVEKDVHSNRDSVSVTARIVRPMSHSADSVSPLIGPPGELHESPLVINHKRGTFSQSSNISTHLAPVNMPREEDLSLSVPSPQTDFVSPALSQASFEDRRFSRRSFGRHRGSPNSQQTTPQFATPGFLTPTIPQEAVSVWEDDPPKTSRTSRFLKRMSTMSNGLKRTSKSSFASTNTPGSTPMPLHAPPANISSTPFDDPTTSRYSSFNNAQKDVPPAVIIGDVNVQFPGQGLWKRRWVEIDDGGYVVFAVAKSPDFHRVGTTKKFHLTEFSRVFVPELDVMELANSVVLELVGAGNGGGMVQCATEDGMAQRQLCACEFFPSPFSS